MKVNFDTWIEMLNVVIEIGKENGYEIYNESNTKELEVFKGIEKSDRYYNTIFLSYEMKSKKRIYRYRKQTSLTKYIITYNQDYGFDGCFGADVRHKREVYINKSEAIERYETLKRNSDICDLDINEE